ncbi:MAG TPA: septum formation initiator family protein [Acidobacteriota bacterium]|nr:septum formation initiator family protein [Acidobacteriota bacterium]
MKKKQEESKSKVPVVAVLFAAVFVSFTLSFFLGQSGVLRLKQLHNEYETLRMQNYRLALENKKAREEMKRLRHDPATIEKIAREELRMVSPHDLVLLVPAEETE